MPSKILVDRLLNFVVKKGEATRAVERWSVAEWRASSRLLLITGTEYRRDGTARPPSLVLAWKKATGVSFGNFSH
jgi:hypothetical protein